MKYRFLFFSTIIFLGIKTNVKSNNLPEASMLSNMAEEELFVEFYSIPSPDEILSYIHNNEIKYTPNILLSSSNTGKYRTNTEKLLALGFFLTDMAYAVSFNKATTSLHFLEAIEDLSKNVNIIPRELSDLGKRIMHNINKLDSLNYLYDEIYLSIIGHLHETGRFGEYAIISAAAFIEILHLVANSEKSQSNEDEFNKRIWEQKMLLDQIQKMFDRYLSPTQNDSLSKDISNLNEAFNQYISLNTTTKSRTLRTGAVLVGVEGPIERVNPPIDDIVKNINNIRTKWAK